jgi:hypothetical protein
MSVGDVTKIPAGGIQAANKVSAVCGSTTNIYLGYDNGDIKKMTTSGVLSELTTKTKLPGKIVALVYTGLTVAMIAILDNGKVYKVHTDGSGVELLVNLNAGIYGAFYYSNYIYVMLDGVQNEGSSAVKIQLA